MKWNFLRCKQTPNASNAFAEKKKKKKQGVIISELRILVDGFVRNIKRSAHNISPVVFLLNRWLLIHCHLFRLKFHEVNGFIVCIFGKCILFHMNRICCHYSAQWFCFPFQFPFYQGNLCNFGFWLVASIFIHQPKEKKNA